MYKVIVKDGDFSLVSERVFAVTNTREEAERMMHNIDASDYEIVEERDDN